MAMPILLSRVPFRRQSCIPRLLFEGTVNTYSREYTLQAANVVYTTNPARLMAFDSFLLQFVYDLSKRFMFADGRGPLMELFL